MQPQWIALSAGEPAGIGAELIVKLAATALPAAPLAIADRNALRRAAACLGSAVQLADWDGGPPPAQSPGVLHVLHTPLAHEEQPGRLDPANAPQVLAVLDRALALCRAGTATALVTAPVHKGVINDAGIPFTGHTEYLAAACGVRNVLMMLAGDDLRVALATTHLPLAAVPAAIDEDRLRHKLELLHRELIRLFGIARPRIAVLGLNPHAGEGGHLGREEIDTIAPAIAAARAAGLDATGPLAADTAFTPRRRGAFDALFAMYHDQGLAPLKAIAFGGIVNITLGLPIVRTSVDHGTALDIAGRGVADVSSLEAAFRLAAELGARAA